MPPASLAPQTIHIFREIECQSPTKRITNGASPQTGPTRFLPGTSVEIIREVKLAAPPRFALFDFDGTLSLVREGWPDVMIPMMVEELAGDRDDANRPPS